MIGEDAQPVDHRGGGVLGQLGDRGEVVGVPDGFLDLGEGLEVGVGRGP